MAAQAEYSTLILWGISHSAVPINRWLLTNTTSHNSGTFFRELLPVGNKSSCPLWLGRTSFDDRDAGRHLV